MVDEEFDNKSNQFIDWLVKNGTTMSRKIQLADLRGQQAGRGVVALEDIDEDEELFSIPRSSILTVETCGLLAEAIKMVTHQPWLALILAMVYEYQQGSKSMWKPYFDILPSQFDTLMYWTKTELDALEGSAVVDKIGKTSAETSFTQLILPVIRKYPNEFNASNLSDEDLQALCHRMGSTIMAYSFDLDSKPTSTKQRAAEGKGTEEDADGWEEASSDDDDDEGGPLPKGMIPLADMLNADASRNNAKLFHSSPSTDHSTTTTSRVSMRALRRISRGEQIFNDYGPLPSADALRRYGYVTENYAPYDVVELSLDLIVTVGAGHDAVTGGNNLSERMKEIGRRVDYFNENFGVEDGYDLGRARAAENSPDDEEQQQFPDDLKAVLNLITMPVEDFEKLQRKGKPPKPEMSNAAARLLYALVVQRAAMYPAESNNHAAASDDSSSARLLMAKQVIAGEKRVLREAAEALSELLQEGTINKRKAPEDFDQEVDEARGGASTSTKKARKTGK